MLLRTELRVARSVGEKMTLGGKWRQLQTMPPACRRYSARQSGVLSGKLKIGTVNACGNLKKIYNAFSSEGLDVRREISCH
jgi:hypothetical protein